MEFQLCAISCVVPSHMLVLLPLVLVCPSECSSVCSSFRSPCVRRPSALSPLFYLLLLLAGSEEGAASGQDTHKHSGIAPWLGIWSGGAR